MATFLYINPDPATQSRATELGCGWMASVPAQYASVATAACAIVAGAGQTVVLPEPTTAQAVAQAAAPILAAEQTASQAAATQQTNADTLRAKAQAALAVNNTYLALAAPTTAQNTAQLKVLTRQVQALIRLDLSILDDVSGT